jgi:hypothetical protein
MEVAVERLWATYATRWLRMMSWNFLRRACSRKRKSTVHRCLPTLSLSLHPIQHCKLNQATLHLYTRRKPWDQFTERWCASDFKHLFCSAQSDVDKLLPLFDIQVNATHVPRKKSVFLREESCLKTCRRLSHADTLHMVGRAVQRQGPHVPDAVKDTVDYLYDKFAKPLLGGSLSMWSDRAPLYADVICRKQVFSLSFSSSQDSNGTATSTTVHLSRQLFNCLDD